MKIAKLEIETLTPLTMISQKDVSEVLKKYDLDNITIGVLGGHSALDVCHGAKKLGFKTVAVCQKGREKTYDKYYKTNGDKGCVDETIVLESFADIVNEDVQNKLRAMNTIFIQNRYFWVYCNMDEIEENFRVPIFGTRHMLRLEERDVPGNQYEILEKAGIRMPKILRKGGEDMGEGTLQRSLDDSSSPWIVKAAEHERSYERDFFIVTSYQDYLSERQRRLQMGVDVKNIDHATIEEYVIGPYVNFNYFYSPLTGEVEVMGTDTRRQTNMDGFVRLTADEQIGLIRKGFKPTMVEHGHMACTTKESIIEKMFELGEKFVETTKKECAPGIIGPFALQGAYVSEAGKEEMVVFDVSMRIPGSPGTRFTPHTGYLYGETISFGERIAMEVRDGVESGKLGDLLT